MNTKMLTDQDLIPVSEAAASLGISEKRLRGFILRNSLRDPIGDMQHVYAWSLKGIADMTSERHSDTSTAVP